MNPSVNPSTTPLEQPTMVASRRRLFSIGLPKSLDFSERRFPLTPEGARMLVEQGFSITMEAGASESIHYTDNQYSAAGVKIGSRNESLGCDIVIHLAPLSAGDIRKMRRGAMLFTLLSINRLKTDALNALLDRHVIAMAIDLIRDQRGNLPFNDLLAEIDGRAAMARASSFLADSVHGKGILLGGVAGVGPCEVTVIGSSIGACAAARSATGAGAIVRLFDHDVYRLREATRTLGPSVIASAMHPRVLSNALRTADVVVYTGVTPPPCFDAANVAQMKRGVIIFDLTDCPGKAFPSLPTIDLAVASPLDISPTEESRACYINTGCAAARTAAMALSNAFATMFYQLTDCEGVANALNLQPGLQDAAITFLGKIVNRRVAQIAGRRAVDIRIFLTLS
ncbi:MAG: hypothetical protein NC338_06110 [Firmicutes bacterium]|nr:hypothetical protein [Bacillota bacterium]MCM1400567.1 hypothetical protein [Bacteroides sp.]MCM1476471.1 hypothetical protein [Bacteroides sp.]